jgi:hypothetical protein
MDACCRMGFPDTNADASLNGSIAQLAKRGRTDTIATCVRVDQRSPSITTWNRASKRKRKLAFLPYHRVHVNEVSYLYCDVHACTVCKWCWRRCAVRNTRRPTSSLAGSPSIVRIRFNNSTEPLTIFCLFHTSERVATWCREHFQWKIKDMASGRVCSPDTSTYIASSTTISSVSVDVFDDIVTQSM